MTTKMCTKCKEIKLLTAFNKKASKPDGLNLECRTCVSAYRKNRYDIRKSQGLPPETYTWEHANRDKLNAIRTAKRREIRDYLRSLKIGKPCDICSGIFPPVAMDWDHLDQQQKSFDICQEGIREMYSVEKLHEEIDKCRLICANCHRIHSAIQRGEDPEEWR